MQASLDLSRWREKPRGLSYRRWVIVSTGLRRLARGRFFRALLIISWALAALLAAAGFLCSQAASPGGSLDSLLGAFGARGAALASTLRALLLLYPDVVVRTLFTFLFWLQSYFALFLSLIALTVLIPGLVTRDRASHALTVYLSRPLTSADYLLGKFGIIVGVLVLLWTGPLLLTWLLSILFASDRDFAVYSAGPLLRALLFNGIALAALAPLAMGISALARSARATIVVWLGLWLVAGFLANVPHMPDWMRRASFSHDLKELRSETLRLDQALSEAAAALPLTSQRFVQSLNTVGASTQPVDAGGSAAGLAVLGGLSALVFFRRLRSE
ncbi:MAG TPA: ABC transporter permease subunit [Opitutaceae bacterium]|jgi:ABC-type transport system involved in multi-copper enzyme maturation permease subunit|nr:ABC transporter permease subunit [Opitutaceae bacterium]